jgi:hypothetical protein
VALIVGIFNRLPAVAVDIRLHSNSAFARSI